MITVIYFFTVGNTALLDSTPMQLFSNLENYGLLAIPLFMLAGELMNGGGITSRLVRFARVLLGHVRGGLAYVAILSNMFLASILGSANAQAAMMSKTLVPEMEKEGYSRDFSSALTLSGSIIAPMLPPSMIFIIYGTNPERLLGRFSWLESSQVCTVVLFCSSLLWVISTTSQKNERATIKQILNSAYSVIPALSIPVIILVGILSGWFTPTESAAIACVIAFFIGKFFYKELTFRKLPTVFSNTVTSTATVTFLIAMAGAFGWMLTFEQIPQSITNTMLSISENTLLFLLLVNALLLLLGAIIDGIAALIILVPVFMPLLAVYEVDPIHFGVIICVNLTIGLLTPPVGTGLFIVSSIANIKFERLVVAMVPFLIVGILILLVITYWEDTTLLIPRLMGLTQ
ncbi:LOW QUALITY PROTEIN: TRAP-type C4-dicarboxylate transport system, large permease component [Geomicrobium sp. JCM 19037]|nr:LOW QUALITY PROTEIN: TRAP-type C4-dicarboxylate transport system, large permease component [Geomicrobium sp. JCM 19037]